MLSCNHDEQVRCIIGSRVPLNMKVPTKLRTLVLLQQWPSCIAAMGDSLKQVSPGSVWAKWHGKLDLAKVMHDSTPDQEERPFSSMH